MVKHKTSRRYSAWAVAGASLVIVAGIAYATVMALSGGSGPDADDAEQVALGQEIYTEACASCHGDGG